MRKQYLGAAALLSLVAIGVSAAHGAGRALPPASPPSETASGTNRNESAAPADRTYDLPRLEGVVIDGEYADWGAGDGLRADLLIPPRAGLETVVRLGWDDKGLLLLARVRDDQWLENADENQLWKNDSIEVCLAPLRGALDVCQWVLSPGMDPKQPSLRHHFYDFRHTEALKKLGAEISAARIKTGDGAYVLEARFPWSALAIEPQRGREVALQVSVNDSDPTSPLSVEWSWRAMFYPGSDSHRDSRKMRRLRLTGGGDPAESRREQLVTACIRGTHANQVAWALREKKGDARAFAPGACTPAQLQSAVQAHQHLLSGDADEIEKWIQGAPSRFDPAGDLQRLLALQFRFEDNLPVVLAMDDFRSRGARGATPAQVKALANLLQLVMEVERDGDLVQEQLKLYRKLNLLIGPCDLGYPDDDDALEEVGLRLGGVACEAPYVTREGAWRITLRKQIGRASCRERV